MESRWILNVAHFIRWQYGYYLCRLESKALSKTGCQAAADVCICDTLRHCWPIIIRETSCCPMRRVSKKGKGSCGGEGSSILFLGSTHKSFSFFHILYIGSTLSMILIWRYTIGLEHWRSMEERRRRIQPRWCHLLQSTMIVQQHLNHLYEIKIPSTINNHHHSTGYSRVSTKAYYHNHHQPADLPLIYFNHNYRSPMMTCSTILVTVINGTGHLIMLLLHPHLSLAYRIQQGRLTKDPHFVLKYTLPMENRMRITIALDSIHHLMQPISTHWKRMQYRLGIANDLLMPSIEIGFLNKTLVYTSQNLYLLRRILSCFPSPPPPPPFH